MKTFLRVLRILAAGTLFSIVGLPQTAVRAADATPPTGTIVINAGRSATNSLNIMLSLTWDDGLGGSGVSRMRFSDDGAHWSAWEPLATIRAYTLPTGPDGHRTVRVQFLDKANNRSAVFSDYISLDTTPPTGAILVNDGMTATTIQTVKLGLAWSDGTGVGVSRMRFSDNGSVWTAWEPPKSACAHMLPTGLGYHTVRVQYLDGAGNYSTVYNDFIKLVAVKEDTVLLPGGVPMVMVWIPGGTFLMGRSAGEQSSFSGEDPQHSVKLNGFWMAKYELTKRQWTAVKGTTPWSGYGYVLSDPDSPAVYVCWTDAPSFLASLNAYTGRNFRLPSEAEWEYACRAGTTTRFYWGDDPSYTAIGDYAWCNAFVVGDRYAQVVGQKLPNAFGLYDMSGNVMEWCYDRWHQNYTGAPTDGSAWNSPADPEWILRGGDWWVTPSQCRSAFRADSPDGRSNTYGFRIAETP